MYDVITIGSATRDVFLISKAFQSVNSNKIFSSQNQCISLGSKIEIDKMVVSTGGGGGNSAVTFANLGFNTATVVRIGDDSSGKDIITDLEKSKVKIDLIKVVKNEQTGFGALLTTPSGARSVLVHRGASAKMSTKDIPWKKLKSKWLYITSLNGNTSLMLKIVKHAKQNNIKIAWNPGSKELQLGIRKLSPILKLVSVINLNLEEAQQLTKTKSKDVKTLFAKFPNHLIVIITDGANGAYAKHDKKIVFVRPQGIKAISRTGAGDAFGSGTIAGLIKGLAIDNALQVGTVNAESVIRKHGAKNGLIKKWPTKTQLAKIKIRTIS